MKCPYCKAKINRNSRFCEVCGKELSFIKSKYAIFTGLLAIVVIALLFLLNGNDEKTYFSEYISYQGKKVSKLPDGFNAMLNNNTNEQGCVGKELDDFGDGWFLIYYYGTSGQSGVLGQAIFQNYTVNSETVTNAYTKLIDIYGAPTKGQKSGGNTVFCWNQVENKKYDLKFIIQQGTHHGEDYMYLSYTKCKGKNDHDDDALEKYFNELG